MYIYIYIHTHTRTHTTQDANPPFGKTLNETVNVPFPVEACLSGVWKNHMCVTHPFQQTRALNKRCTAVLAFLFSR